MGLMAGPEDQLAAICGGKPDAYGVGLRTAAVQLPAATYSAGAGGIALNHKRLFRLYRQEKLGVRKRSGRKRALGTRAPMVLPEAPNQRWSLDFVSDALNSGRRICLTVSFR